MRSFIIIFATLASLFGVSAHAQTITGEIAVRSGYVDQDLFAQIDTPILTGFVWIDISQCSVDLELYKGLVSTSGDEVGVGASCRFDLPKGFNAEVSVVKFFTTGIADTTVLAATLTKGALKLTVSRFLWSEGNPDATRVELGYETGVLKALDARVFTVFETGFGSPDILIVGAGTSYDLGHSWRLEATVMTPVINNGSSTQVVVGVVCAF